MGSTHKRRYTSPSLIEAAYTKNGPLFSCNQKSDMILYILYGERLFCVSYISCTFFITQFYVVICACVRMLCSSEKTGMDRLPISFGPFTGFGAMCGLQYHTTWYDTLELK